MTDRPDFTRRARALRAINRLGTAYPALAVADRMSKEKTNAKKDRS
jgi:hypothetical protein